MTDDRKLTNDLELTDGRELTNDRELTEDELRHIASAYGWSRFGYSGPYGKPR